MELPNDIILWGFSIGAWITIATVMGVITVMLLTKVRADAVMLIAIGVLFVTGVLDAKEMCSGLPTSTSRHVHSSSVPESHRRCVVSMRATTTPSASPKKVRIRTV